MHPILFRIGAFEVRSFGLLMVVAVVTALWMGIRRAPRFGIPSSRITDLAFWLVMMGVLGSRVAFIAQEWPYYSRHLDEVLSLRFEGLTSFGGIIFGFVTLWVWCRNSHFSLWSVADVMGIPFLIAAAIGRMGCLFNGCCYGGVTSSPIGVHIEGLVGPRQPVQLYDALMLCVGAAILILLERRQRTHGFIIGGTFLVYGLSRAIYEIWRAGISSTYWGSLPITQAQAMALALALVGATIMWVRGGKSVEDQCDSKPQYNDEPGMNDNPHPEVSDAGASSV